MDSRKNVQIVERCMMICWCFRMSIGCGLLQLTNSCWCCKTNISCRLFQHPWVFQNAKLTLWTVCTYHLWLMLSNEHCLWTFLLFQLTVIYMVKWTVSVHRFNLPIIVHVWRCPFLYHQTGLPAHLSRLREKMFTKNSKMERIYTVEI